MIREVSGDVLDLGTTEAHFSGAFVRHSVVYPFVHMALVIQADLLP